MRKPFWALTSAGLFCYALALAGALNPWCFAALAGSVIAWRELEGRSW